MSYSGHNGQQDATFDCMYHILYHLKAILWSEMQYANVGLTVSLDVVDHNPFAYKFPQHDQADHMVDQSHAPLMNQDQQDLMNNFFEHPDTALPNNDDNIPYNFRGFELSGDATMNALGMHMPNGMNFAVGGSNGGMHMTAPSIPSVSRNADHMALPHLSHNDVSSGYEGFFQEYDRDNNSYTQHPITHDNQAATALMNMSSHSQENPQPAVASELSGSSWGNLNMGNPTGFAGDQLNSPVVSGGPSSGSTTTPLTPTFAHQYQRPGRAASLAQSQYPQHSTNFMRHAMQSGNYQHTRHPSLQVGDSGSHTFAQSQPQQWPAQDYPASRRPPLIQYGSDQSFGRQGYLGTAYTAAEDKATNLLNVPLATQVARDSHAPFASAQQTSGVRGGHQQRHSVPNNLHHLSAAASHYDSMPTTNQTQSQAANQFQPLRVMDSIVPSQQFRKRRISEVEDNNDNVARAVQQTHPIEANNAPRRAPVIPKQEPTNEHENTWTTPPGSGNKRRKSTVQAQCVRSTASASPSTPIDASLKPSSSTKKRRSDSNTKNRQNLSDTQKRNNHIASEQKRRDAMKTNYDVLNQYVPTLHGGQHGLSRSEILQHSADWLQALQMGNQAVMAAFGLKEVDFAALLADDDD